jgi:hypothetical protein
MNEDSKLKREEEGVGEESSYIYTGFQSLISLAGPTAPLNAGERSCKSHVIPQPLPLLRRSLPSSVQAFPTILPVLVRVQSILPTLNPLV